MTHYDIALIGSGSVNSFPGPDLADKRLVQIDRGVGPHHVFGGTCLNVGCIPTKMFVHTANVAADAAGAARFGLAPAQLSPDWPAIRDRIFGRIDPIAEGGEAYRRGHEDNANLTLLRGTARFTGPTQVEVELADGGTEQVSADVFVLGAGSRPSIPSIPGLREAKPHTSDTIMRLPELPASLAILGSGVIAVEMAHVFASLGVEVTMIARSQRLLRAADRDISERLTELLAARVRVVTGFTTERVERTEQGVTLHGMREGSLVQLEAQELLVATGRQPNSDLLDCAAAGIDTDQTGRVVVDAHQRVLRHGQVLDGMWALGDLSSPAQLKHVANHELRIVRHNILHPGELRRSDTMPVPFGVFTSPQVAWVGLDEVAAQARAQANGRQVRVAMQEYASIAYGWAMEDTTGFLKLVVDAETTEILGAHLIGPEATTLIQVLVQAMSTGQTARDIARSQYWIHPAMPELIENALLQVID